MNWNLGQPVQDKSHDQKTPVVQCIILKNYNDWADTSDFSHNLPTDSNNTGLFI